MKNILNTFSVKGLKTFNTFDGLAYSGTLVMGKQKIATVHNDGNGGMTMYNFVSPDAEKSFNKVINDLNVRQDMFDNGWDFVGTPDKIYTEAIISEIFEEFIAFSDWSKKVKKLEKNSILYGVVNSDNIMYAKYKVNLSDIVSKYPNGKDILQKKVDEIKSKLTNNQVILNTNLQSLGVIV